MKRVTKKTGKMPTRETLTEAYEVRAFRDESEEQRSVETAMAEVLHAAPGEIQAIKAMARGHGEQSVLPDDCQFGDNDLCFVDA